MYVRVCGEEGEELAVWSSALQKSFRRGLEFIAYLRNVLIIFFFI